MIKENNFLEKGRKAWLHMMMVVSRWLCWSVARQLISVLKKLLSDGKIGWRKSSGWKLQRCSFFYSILASCSRWTASQTALALSRRFTRPTNLRAFSCRTYVIISNSSFIVDACDVIGCRAGLVCQCFTTPSMTHGCLQPVDNALLHTVLVHHELQHVLRPPECCQGNQHCARNMSCSWLECKL